jgi:hypothetical protein
MDGAMEICEGHVPNLMDGGMDDFKFHYEAILPELSQPVPKIHPDRIANLAWMQGLASPLDPTRDIDMDSQAEQNNTNPIGQSRASSARNLEQPQRLSRSPRQRSERYDPNIYPDYYVPSYQKRDRSPNSHEFGYRPLRRNRRTSSDYFQGVEPVDRYIASVVAAMADLDFKRDDRGDDRRDRGRSRGNRDNRGGNNKRRRDGKLEAVAKSWQMTDFETDEDDNQYNDRGPQRRRPNDRRDDRPPRREPYVEPPFAKLRRLILNIASSTKLPEDEAIEIAEYLRDNYDDEKTRNQFFDIFVQL